MTPVPSRRSPAADRAPAAAPSSPSGSRGNGLAPQAPPPDFPAGHVVVTELLRGRLVATCACGWRSSVNRLSRRRHQAAIQRHWRTVEKHRCREAAERLRQAADELGIVLPPTIDREIAAVTGGETRPS